MQLPLRASTQSLSDSRDKSSIQSGAGGHTASIPAALRRQTPARGRHVKNVPEDMGWRDLQEDGGADLSL
ncbi:hypothetical protein CesoFtcFv8_026082 [Champsocephalus esox]|uniref:Uncharacterized protein n=1 Tax=Champsocephalus esox TaxID=159716 RepID=A0AAN8GET9_9TELE|nr:hypothetical protein CesoFtcFv8_026082 [Champsocephalus esox]